MNNDKIKLNNNIEIPLQGFGVFQINDENLCEQVVISALKEGYRLFDTAACYGNERAVGLAIKHSEVLREEVFITSKVWIQDAGYQKTMISFEKTLQNLQTDYLDLYLIHMPFGDYHGSWRAMEELFLQGKVKAIGVSNFTCDRLVDIILSHNIKPAVNQMETHPFCQQQELRRIMEKYDIKLMAWAPFAEGKNEIFQNNIFKKIGERYQKSPAQVILRWLKQNGIIAIPKSTRVERIKENFDINDFELSAADMSKISELDMKKSLILDIKNPQEVCRLYNIHFEQ